jgi:ferritin
VKVASEEKDNATQDFLWGFVREQVEEEAQTLDIVDKMKRTGEAGILFLNYKLAER